MSEVKYLVFDTETTGIDVFEDRIVQLFVATADEDGNLLETWEWLIDPGIDVPEGASDVHGFTTDFLRERGQDALGALTEAWDTLYDHWGLIHVAFNVSFDLSILHYEFARHGIDYFFGQEPRQMDLFDPLVVDRAEDRYRKGKRKLENVAGHYGVPFNPDEAHKADYDVEITAKVAAQVAKKYGIPGNADQAEMHRAWAENFESFLRRSNPDATVEREWPLKLKEKGE